MYVPDEFSFTAILRGRLEVREACLVVIDQVGQARTVIWPSPATVWDPINGRISVDNMTAQVGDAVSLGGGEVRFVDGAIPESWIVPPAPACSTGAMWLASGITEVGPFSGP